MFDKLKDIVIAIIVLVLLYLVFNYGYMLVMLVDTLVLTPINWVIVALILVAIYIFE